MASKNISIRMDADLKSQAEELFGRLGMNISTAFNIFVRQCLYEDGIPFEISRRPNAESLAAMAETEMILADPNYPGYTDIDAMMEDLLK